MNDTMISDNFDESARRTANANRSTAAGCHAPVFRLG